MKILCIQLARFGDVYQTWPVMRALRRNNENAEIDILVREKFADKAADTTALWPLSLHRLRVTNEADRSGELRIFDRGSETGHRLRVRHAGGQFENLLRQIVDSLQVAATAGDENAFAELFNGRQPSQVVR